MSTNTNWDALAEAFDLIEDAEIIQEFEDNIWISVSIDQYKDVMKTIHKIREE